MQHAAKALLVVILLASICPWLSAAGDAAESYTTKRGDALWEIAKCYDRDDTISTHQMMLALLHANPGAFINNNINLLKTGYVLRIPTRAEIRATRVEDAIAEVTRQGTAWREQRTPAAGKPSVNVAETTRNAHAFPAPPETGNESHAAAITEPPASVAEARSEPRSEKASSENAGAAPGVGTPDIAMLQQAPALAQAQSTQRQVENDVLRARVAAMEEKLTKIDERIAIQHEAPATPQQRLAEVRGRAVASGQTAAGSGEATLAPPRPRSRTTAWPDVPAIVMVIGGMIILGLALIWFRVRRATENTAVAEISANVATPSRAEPLAAEEDDALELGIADLDLGAAPLPAEQDVTAAEPASLDTAAVAEAVLTELMIDLDDLVLEPHQGGADAPGPGAFGAVDATGKDGYERAASPSLPNTASRSPKADPASPSNVC